MAKKTPSSLLKIFTYLSIAVLIFLAAMATKIIYHEAHTKKRLNGFVVHVDKGIIDSLWMVPAYRDTTVNPDGSLHVVFSDTTYWMRIRNGDAYQDWPVSKTMLEVHQKGDAVKMGDRASYRRYVEQSRKDELRNGN